MIDLATTMGLALVLLACVLGEVDVQVNVGKLRSSAEAAFSEGRPDESLKLWAQVIAAEPDNHSNYYKRFRVYLRKLKYKEAVADLTSALGIKPVPPAASSASSGRSSWAWPPRSPPA